LEGAVDRSGSTALSGASTRTVDLPGRPGSTVWDVPGPDGAPTLVLLHGVTLTSSLNWGGVVETLSRRYRVVLLDQRGHGTAPRTSTFRLEDCADDVAALADHLGIDRLIPVGYSMGGQIAQLVWRRHRELVAGLVLCSTSRNMSGALWEQSAALVMPGLVAAAMWVPGARALRADLIGAALLDHDSDPSDRRWALAEMRRTSLVDALAAMQAVSEFTSHRWIGSVDVPTAVVVTRHDRVVHPGRQRKLALALPGSTVIELDGGHDVFLGSPRRFAAAVDAACAAASAGATAATAMGA
jgi:pimeloyl-ACP methyl ester carboxylesterase